MFSNVHPSVFNNAFPGFVEDPDELENKRRVKAAEKEAAKGANGWELRDVEDFIVLATRMK
jgi:hypothetical protein